MLRWISGAGALFLVTTILSGCGSDPGYSDDQFIPTEGAVQFVNMMPDSPQIRMFHGLSQDDVSFPFATPVEVRFVDRYDWEIAYVNTANDRVTVAEGENQQISEDVLTTFLFMGNTTQANVQIIDTPLIAQADRPDDVSEIWFANNSSRFDMVDIYLIDADALLDDQSPLVSVTSGTYTQLISVPAGTSRRLWITVAGTNEVIFDSGAIQIPEKSQELFGLVDDFGPGGSKHVNVIRTLAQSRSVIPDFSQGVELRAANYTTLGNIDVTVGDNSFTGISEGSISSYQQATNGTLATKVEIDGNTTEETETEVVRGIYQSLISFDDPDNAGLSRSVNVLDSFRPITNRSEFKFINGSSQTVDLYALRDGQDTDDVPPLLNNVGFGGTNTTESFPESLRLVVTNQDGTETLNTLTRTLIAGESYTLIFDTRNELYLLEE